VLLAELRIQLKHANPIGWACLGIAKSYLGNPEAGFHHTLLPRVIADRHRSGIRSTRWAALRRDVVAGGTGLKTLHCFTDQFRSELSVRASL